MLRNCARQNGTDWQVGISGWIIAAVALLWFVDARVTAAEPTQDVVWKRVSDDGVIAAPGHYFLPQDIRTKRPIGIEIRADNVVLDFRGRALRSAQPPRKGLLGVVVNGRRAITIRNGRLGGFWFNTHCTRCRQLRIEDMTFDDIAYIGVNVAHSQDVRISNNRFTRFRYDIRKPRDKYLIGINVGAERAVICQNRFRAEPEAGSYDTIDLETVFVLFSARVSQRCLVSLNTMEAARPLPRSYGVWVARDNQVSIVSNTLRNLQYAVSAAQQATVLVSRNEIGIGAGETPPFSSYGVSAKSAKSATVLGNTFKHLAIPTLVPESSVVRDNVVP